jgi:hypothetical protein
LLSPFLPPAGCGGRLGRRGVVLGLRGAGGFDVAALVVAAGVSVVVAAGLAVLGGGVAVVVPLVVGGFGGVAHRLDRPRRHLAGAAGVVGAGRRRGAERAAGSGGWCEQDDRRDRGDGEQSTAARRPKSSGQVHRGASITNRDGRSDGHDAGPGERGERSAAQRAGVALSVAKR